MYNDMFNHMDGTMWAVAKKKTHLKDNLNFAAKLACQKLFKYYIEVTPTPGMLLIWAHILDRYWQLWYFSKWEKRMHINPENDTFYTTQYQEAYLICLENNYCAKYRCWAVIKSETVLSNDLFSFAIASRSCQSSYGPYAYSNDDEENLQSKNLADEMSRLNDHTEH